MVRVAMAFVPLTVIVSAAVLFAADSAPLSTAAPASDAALAVAIAPEAPPLVARDLRGARPEVSALALAGTQGGELTLALWATPLPAAPAPAAATSGRRAPSQPSAAGQPTPAAANLAFVVEVDGASLLHGASGDAVAVELAAFAVTSGGAVTGFIAEGVRIDAVEKLAGSGLRWVGALSLPAGEGSIRVVVRQRATGAFGVRALSVTVPKVGAFEPHAPAFSAVPGDWIVVRSSRLAASPAVDLAALLGRRPAALPVIDGRGGGKLGVRLAPGTAATLELRRPGKTEAVVSLPVQLAGAPDAAGLLDGTLPPLSVETAVYDLQLVVGPGLSTPPVRVAVLDLRPGDPVPVWPALVDRRGSLPASPTAPAARAAAAAAVAAAPDAEDLASIAAIRKSYRDILARFATGDPGAAQGMRDLQEAAFLSNRKGAERWEQAIREEVATFGADRREALLPIAELDHRLFETRLSENRPGHAQMALRAAVHSVERYGELAASAEEKALAAATLLGYAGSLFEVSAHPRAAELAAIAERFAPNDATALLVQAFVREKNGDAERAAVALDRLLVAHPGHREARLRRAIVDRREGRSREAGRMLRALVAESATDWITSVAAQELGRMLVASGDSGEAAQLLMATAGRLPNDPALVIGAAWALQESGQRSEIDPMLERMPVPSRIATDTPRHRYGRWPEEPLLVARRGSEEAAFLRLPALAAALGLPAVPPAEAGPTTQAEPTGGQP